MPLVEIIKNGNLKSHFPERSLGDLFVYISVYQWEKSDRKRSYGIGLNLQVPQNMEEFRAKMATLDKGEYPDMLREITVFVLMNVEARKENRVIDKLIQLEEITEIHSVHGSVDLVLKILLKRNLVMSDAETIGDFVHSRIRQIPGVLSTQTLIPGFSHVRDQDHSAGAK